MDEPDRIKVNVAILGGGFTGVYCAKALRRRLGRDSTLRVGLVAEENHMVFQPMLPEVVSASVSPRHVVNPLRLLCRGVEVLKGKVESIHWPERRLILHAGDFTGCVEVRFDHLVLALGAVVDLSRIPGMPEHAFLMRNVGDAMLLRSTIISRIEEANLESRTDVKRRLLSFVVVGGGYSGVETAGQILDLFRAIHGYYSNVSFEDLRVSLVHGGSHLLPTLSRRLGEYTARRLQAHGLNLILGDRVKSVTAGSVMLERGPSIETNTVISTVGNAPHPLVSELCRANQWATERGKIATDPTCRVKGQTRLWAGGDCAAVPHADGGDCPDTAQFAMRQGLLLGQNIARSYRQMPLEKFAFKGFGELAAIGHRTAVANLLGVNFSGFIAWWIWRTIYLAKLPGFDRKLRVMIDWTLDLFFPRDINLLTPRYSRVFREIYLPGGGVLFHRGEPAFSLYIVKRGRIEIADREGVVQTIGPGEYFGERALLQDRIWQFDARAGEPTVLVSVPADTFYQIVQGSGSLGRLFQKSAARYQSREVIQSMTDRMPPEMLGRSAEELMHTRITTLRPGMCVREAIEITRAHPHSTYPVVDDGGGILGVVQREDFYEFLKDRRTGPETPLKEMSWVSLPTVPKDAPLSKVMERIVRGGASKVLVTDGDHRLLGMITLMDLVAQEGNGAGENPKDE